MPYAIRVFDKAEGDLLDLLRHVPKDRWDAVIDAIDGILLNFARAPVVVRPPRMVIPLHFTAGGTKYRWLASWRYDQDETRISITAFGRDPTTIL